MKKIAVIGAGAIGISSALELTKRGLAVVLLDSNQPASQASYGNAGVICTNGIAPYASPDAIKHLYSYGMNRDPRFLFHWPHLLHLAPWLWRFILNCNQRTFESGMKSLDYICQDAVVLHRELLKKSNALHLINDRGWLRLYRTRQSYAASQRERSNYKRLGVPHREINTEEIRELEPAIKREYAGGILLERSPSVRNPQQIYDVYFQQMLEAGGRFINQRAHQITPTSSGWRVRMENDHLNVDGIVVAGGAYTPELIKPLKINLPMAIERGYHLAYLPRQNNALSRSIIDMDKGLVMTPMRDESSEFIRVTSAVNLIAKPTSPSYKQITRLIPEIESIFPLQHPLTETPWMGHRPSTPDSLPIIGPAPNNPGLWLAFGHGHLGFTLGPKTGQLIAQSILNKEMDPQSQAFLPSRF